MQSSSDMARVAAFISAGTAVALVPCRPTGPPTGSNALIPAGTAAALVPEGGAGALVSTGTTIAFVSVCATAEKAARMKTKITLKLFMVLQFCGFRQNSSNLRRSGATEGNHPVT